MQTYEIGLNLKCKPKDDDEDCCSFFHLTLCWFGIIQRSWNDVSYGISLTVNVGVNNRMSKGWKNKKKQDLYAHWIRKMVRTKFIWMSNMMIEKTKAMPATEFIDDFVVSLSDFESKVSKASIHTRNTHTPSFTRCIYGNLFYKCYAIYHFTEEEKTASYCFNKVLLLIIGISVFYRKIFSCLKAPSVSIYIPLTLKPLK